MMQFKVFVLAITAFVGVSMSSANATTVWEQNCGESRTEPKFKYCVHSPKGSLNANVVYSFHGGGGSVGQWPNSPRSVGIRNAWDKDNLAAPTVVEISYGDFWFALPRLGTPGSGYVENLATVAIPFVERQLLAKPVGKRYAMGFSMGGFNAIMTGLFYPNLFTGLILISPAIPSISPYASRAEFQQVSRESGLKIQTLKDLSNFFGDSCPKVKLWISCSPLLIAPGRLSPASPPIYMSIGGRDLDYAYGAKQLLKIVQKSGARVVAEVIPNGIHGATNFAAIARLLSF